MFEVYKAKRTLKKALVEAQVKELQLSTRILKEAYPEYVGEDEDESDWNKIFSGDTRHKTVQSLKTLRNESRKLYLLKPHARGTIDILLYYLVGKGFTFEATGKNAERQNEVWKNFCRINWWWLKEQESVKRAFRDGEAFLRLFKDNKDTRVRFIDPEDINSDKHSFGIETGKNDTETPVNYFYHPPNAQRGEPIEADKIIHIKIGVDSNVKRGIAYLLPLITYIKRYEGWLDDRLILNKIRSAIAMIRKHKGASPSQISAFADAQKTDTKKDSKTGISYRRQKYKPGTIIDESEGTEHKFLSPEINAPDVKDDGRNVLLTIAACTCLTESMVSGDASNANYASSLVAEAPATKMFGWWQTYYGHYFEILYDRVMKNAGIENAEVKVVPERIIYRDPEKHAKSNEVKRNNGIISKKFWRAEEGIDNEAMEEEILAEMEGS